MEAIQVKEAKEKICPFIQTHLRLGDKVMDKNINCLCGSCMAWEYTKDKHDSGGIMDEDQKEGYCIRLQEVNGA